MKISLISGFSALCGVLVACTPFVDGVKTASRASQRNAHSAGIKWGELFTYNPPPSEPQLPQTRFCYKMASDVVCYDSPQPITSPLTGYQIGAAPGPTQLVAGVESSPFSPTATLVRSAPAASVSGQEPRPVQEYTKPYANTQTPVMVGDGGKIQEVY